MCALVTGVQTCALPIWLIAYEYGNNLDKFRNGSHVSAMLARFLHAEFQRTFEDVIHRPKVMLHRANRDSRVRRQRTIGELAQPLPGDQPDGRPDQRLRSEEHTSELQSLMRISYAVFCLKKKKNK